jgi:polysaccharide pyruvyl transferase WcaK-like protein
MISSRYHPIVFALAAGIPALGIYGDEYCRIKLQGALAHAQLERWTITCDDVMHGTLLTRTLELWRCRAEIRRELESRREAWRTESRARWSTVLRALNPGVPLPSAVGGLMFGRPAAEVVQLWLQPTRP